jgi:hypothetical protein
VLHTLVALPWDADRASLDQADECLRPYRVLAQGRWPSYFEKLVNEGRGGMASVSGRRYWVAAERARSFAALFPSAVFEQTLADIETASVSRDDALLTLVTGWMSHLGPATASQLGDMLGLSASDIEKALLRMEASGTVLRSNFSGSAAGASHQRPHEQDKRRNGVSGGCWRGFIG